MHSFFRLARLLVRSAAPSSSTTLKSVAILIGYPRSAQQVRTAEKSPVSLSIRTDCLLHRRLRTYAERREVREGINQLLHSSISDIIVACFPPRLPMSSCIKPGVFDLSRQIRSSVMKQPSALATGKPRLSCVHLLLFMSILTSLPMVRSMWR